MRTSERGGREGGREGGGGWACCDTHPLPLPTPCSFLLWDGYGVLPNLCGTQYQQKKPAAAAAAAASAGEGEGEAAAPPSGQQQPQRTAALCSLPATSVVDMVRESKVRLLRGEGGGAPGGEGCTTA